MKNHEGIERRRLTRAISIALLTLAAVVVAGLSVYVALCFAWVYLR